jgi:hypothetical protein
VSTPAVDRDRKRKAAKRARRECRQCSSPCTPGNKSFCAAHLVAYRSWRKQYAADRKAAGVCISCMSPVSSEGSTRCKEHHSTELVRSRTKMYGISPDLATEMLVKQGGACAICEDEPTVKALALDHNHISNVARGLLCDPCNLGISLLKDNSSIILRAAQYVLSSGFHA